jgi:hypothetical protein
MRLDSDSLLGALVPVDSVRSRAIARARKFGPNALITLDSDSDDGAIVPKAASHWRPGSCCEGPNILVHKYDQFMFNSNRLVLRAPR